MLCVSLCADAPAEETPAPAAPAVAAGEVEAEDYDEATPNILYNYPAWKTFPVRVNNLAPNTTSEELLKAFALVSE